MPGYGEMALPGLRYRHHKMAPGGFSTLRRLAFILLSSQHDCLAMRLLSYNIHKGIGGRDRRYSLERIIGVIEHENPDIICLQEVDRNVRRSHYHDQMKMLAEHFRAACAPATSQRAAEEWRLWKSAAQPLAAGRQAPDLAAAGTEEAAQCANRRDPIAGRAFVRRSLAFGPGRKRTALANQPPVGARPVQRIISVAGDDCGRQQ